MFENKQLIFFSDKNSKYCTVIELSVVCTHTEIPKKSGTRKYVGHNLHWWGQGRLFLPYTQNKKSEYGG